MKTSRSTRRTFIKKIGSAGVLGPFAVPAFVRGASPNNKLNIASIGVGGKGWTDVNQATSGGHNLIAFCDVVTSAENHNRGGYVEAAKKWPKARRYQDWRAMLEEGTDIDAVTISTPDHMHAMQTLAAIRLGKHVYTQKPLTHTVQEARVLMRAAREHGVKT